MSGTDRHVDDADLVLHLSNHDAGFACVGRHPMQNAGGGTHRISAVKLYARSSATHGHSNISAQNGVPVLCLRKGIGKRREVRSCVVVASSRHTHVFGDHGVAFFLELFPEDVF